MNSTQPASFTRMTRVLAGVSIVPALFLPCYEAFLHGCRRAVDIKPRAAAYLGAHMLGAYCMLLAGVGLLAQASYAGTLFIDGFFNPLLAHYDPVIQTQFHTGDFSGAVAHSALLQSFGIVLYIPILMSLLYIVGIGLLGIIILLKRFLPWPIGI